MATKEECEKLNSVMKAEQCNKPKINQECKEYFKKV